MSGPAPRLLLVDDDPRNLRILGGILAPLRYDLRQATNGQEALDQVAAEPPDLILLDVMMPGLSGFEVCQQLKAQLETRFIPVVLVTALTERESKIAGLEAGADDFINKPVDAHELRARVKSLLRIKQLHDELAQQTKNLEEANRHLQQTLSDKEQAQEALVRSESMAAIGTLVAGVAHELNNPLGAAYSLTQTVQEMIQEDTAEQLQQEKEEIVGHLAFSRKELNRAKEIVAALLGLSRQNQDYTEAVDLNTVVQDALRVLYNQYKKYEVNIAEEYEEGLPAVQGNFAQLGQMCMNLIKNAIEALKGQEGQIVLKTYRDGGQVVFECADTGPGIPGEVRQNIFKPFFTTKAPGEGTGLGLYICHQTVEKHKGKIEVESEVGKGTRFRVRLPAGAA